MAYRKQNGFAHKNEKKKRFAQDFVLPNKLRIIDVLFDNVIVSCRTIHQAHLIEYNLQYAEYSGRNLSLH